MILIGKIGILIVIVVIFRNNSRNDDRNSYIIISQDKTGDDIFVLPLSCPAGVLPKLGTRHYGDPKTPYVL